MLLLLLLLQRRPVLVHTHLSERHRFRRTSVSVKHTTSRRLETVVSCCSNMAAKKRPIVAFVLIVGCSLVGEWLAGVRGCYVVLLVMGCLSNVIPWEM